jgi:hypothetical protein
MRFFDSYCSLTLHLLVGALAAIEEFRNSILIVPPLSSGHSICEQCFHLDNEEFANLPLFRQLIRLGEGFGGGNRCGDGILGP